MSLPYRLAEIEEAIPYADVVSQWANSREKWRAALITNQANTTRLAEFTLELLDAFTPSCKKFLWSDDEGGFTRVRESCQKAAIASGKKALSAEKGLREVR